jgi:glycosyltransferase involved in cell wall biosynthesis
MIDIIMPAYNCSSTLDRTLQSLSEQTNKNFNLIFVDDCSTENLTTILSKYGDKINIIYVRNTTNLGCGLSRQVGIQNLVSEYFMFCDSDDIVLPKTVEIFHREMEKNPEIVIGKFYRQSKDGRFGIELSNFTWCHGKLYSKKAFEKYNIENKAEFSRWSDDVYLNYICKELCKPTFINDVLYKWMYTDDSATRQEEKENNYDNYITYLKSVVAAYDHVIQYKPASYFITYQTKNIKLRNADNPEEVELYNRICQINETNLKKTQRKSRRF